MKTGYSSAFIKSLPLGQLVVSVEDSLRYKKGEVFKVVTYPGYGNATLKMPKTDVNEATTGHGTHWQIFDPDWKMEDYL